MDIALLDSFFGPSQQDFIDLWQLGGFIFKRSHLSRET